MKKKLFGDDVFMVDVEAFCGTTQEMINKCEKLGIDYAPREGVLGACKEKPDSRGFIVWLVDPNDFYVLMHETLHLVRMVFENVAVPTDLSYNDEAVAYYQMFWFRKLWRWFGNLKEANGN